MIGGELWGNVWQTECIARVDLTTGRVKAWIMLTGLTQSLHLKHTRHAGQMDVLNGIAYDVLNKRIFITGKKWPQIFEIVPAPLAPDSKMTVDEARRKCWPPAWNV